MKQLIIYVSALFLTIMAVELQAQQRDMQAGMNAGPGLQIGLLYSDDFNLTDDQKMAIGRLVNEHRTELRAERGNRQRGARFEHRTELHENILGILTPQQRTIYEERMKEVQENRETAHRFRMLAQADLISEEARLNPDQKAKVMEVVSAHMKETAKYRQENRRAAVRPDVDTQIERLETRRDFMNSLKELMTEEQYEVWEKEWFSAARGPQMNRRNIERRDERRERPMRQQRQRN